MKTDSIKGRGNSASNSIVDRCFAYLEKANNSVDSEAIFSESDFKDEVNAFIASGFNFKRDFNTPHPLDDAFSTIEGEINAHTDTRTFSRNSDSINTYVQNALGCARLDAFSIHKESELFDLVESIFLTRCPVDINNSQRDPVNDLVEAGFGGTPRFKKNPMHSKAEFTSLLQKLFGKASMDLRQMPRTDPVYELLDIKPKPADKTNSNPSQKIKKT